MKSLPALLSVAILSAAAAAQGYVYEQPMDPNGGTLRPCQLWIDPTGQNDLDSDAIAWEDFKLPQTTTIARLRWWGETAPPLGFQVSFFNQDPNTVAVQPDIFAPGSGPISEDIYTSFTQTAVPGGMSRFEVALVTPLIFNANTRYFVSAVGLTPIPFAEWKWAANSTGPNGTFYWVRGMHTYMHLPESRAMELATFAGWPVGTPFCFGDGSSGACPCGNLASAGRGCANSTGVGAILEGFGTAVVVADTVVLTARNCPPAKVGIFLSGHTSVGGLPFGDGLRCLGGGLMRLGAVTSNAAGVATSNMSLSIREGLLGGEQRHYQYWYRDPIGPCGHGFSLTNALSVQW